MDFLFTTGKPPAAAASRSTPIAWKVNEYSALRLVPREAGSSPNQHPAATSAAQLRSSLATVEAVLRPGLVAPLLSAPELADLAPTLSTALAAAGPDDDVLLISTSRREQGLLGAPLSVTARLFVQDGALQMIVHEARFDALSTWRAARVLPSPGFGSRGQASGVTLRGAAAVARRADWLALALAGAAASPAAPVASGSAARAAPADSAVERPRDASFYDAQAQRLKGLLNLREQGLISEEEYQRKRLDILQSL
jgi:hypothetical protein